MGAGVWQDDTAWVLWQDQWDKGDEYALNILAVHCPKCPAKFVNNVYVRDGISRTLAALRCCLLLLPSVHFDLKRLFKAFYTACV